ncbi:hypothetical protein HLH26_05690 [Gluconacetobacter sp. 1b LMG 1731]|uniref:Terminase n=1 Tax=Gluconacetobacter dulcium TaxID=2729096 RepID=A0A7W4NRX9_9PROT|nr:P27 family phage terminase small subunit [Gluconacetobacter dulcium]MBB2164036.1 hypothetical protein [Gluconacetobacter dulcium]MBB2192740.1 hypothetical protein [Gluconacetobacter dulcium]
MKKQYPLGIKSNKRREQLFNHYTSQAHYIADHEPALVQLVTLITDAEDLRALIDAEGIIYSAGLMKRPHPAVAMLRTVQSGIISYAGKFGLTPSDAKALSKGVEKDEDFSAFDDL